MKGITIYNQRIRKESKRSSWKDYLEKLPKTGHEGHYTDICKHKKTSILFFYHNVVSVFHGCMLHFDSTSIWPSFFFLSQMETSFVNTQIQTANFVQIFRKFYCPSKSTGIELNSKI